MTYKEGDSVHMDSVRSVILLLLITTVVAILVVVSPESI